MRGRIFHNFVEEREIKETEKRKKMWEKYCQQIGGRGRGMGIILKILNLSYFSAKFLTIFRRDSKRRHSCNKSEI